MKVTAENRPIPRIIYMIPIIIAIGPTFLSLPIVSFLRYEQLRELFFIEEKLNDIVRLYGKKRKKMKRQK